MEMKLKIEYRKVSELLPYARNARTHSDTQVSQLAASIKEFGFNNPVAIDADGMILCGHGRVMAAQKLGLTEVPTVCLSHLSDTQKKAYILADNKLALNAGWDNDMLKVELEDLKFSNFDLDLVGFSTEELDEIMNQDEEPEVEDDDYTVAVPQEPKAKLGEVYILGKHRLMCGDSTSIQDVEKLMGGGEYQADLLLTDPPYNVDYEGGTDKKLKIKNDNMEDQAFRQFLIDVYKAADHVMKPGAPFYIWHADSEGANFRGAAKDMGWQIRECLIWVKNSLVLGRQDYQWRHEPCLYGWKAGAAHYFTDSRAESTVIEDQVNVDKLSKDELKTLCKKLLDPGIETTVIREKKPSINDVHPTMKPVKLFGRLVKNSSKRNDIVLDLFGGSGTTIVACEQLNRRAYLMELDPAYVDVIIDRYQKLTNVEVMRSDGKLWNEL
nr:MAG TPA: adenine specific DNA methyltransferase [Bacteriophage sp.]